MNKILGSVLSPLCSERGAAAADLPVTDFLLLITILKSKICVKEFYPLIILSISVQSVLIPSVLFRPGEWCNCTLNNERLEFLTQILVFRIVIMYSGTEYNHNVLVGAI